LVGRDMTTLPTAEWTLWRWNEDVHYANEPC
jgi:hypothetical protein